MGQLLEQHSPCTNGSVASDPGFNQGGLTVDGTYTYVHTCVKSRHSGGERSGTDLPPPATPKITGALNALDQCFFFFPLKLDTD